MQEFIRQGALYTSQVTNTQFQEPWTLSVRVKKENLPAGSTHWSTDFAKITSTS